MLSLLTLVPALLHSDLIDELRKLGGFVHPSLEAVLINERGTGLRLVKGAPRLEAGEMLIAVPPTLQLSWIAVERAGLPLTHAVNQLLPEPEQWDMRLSTGLLALEHAQLGSGSSHELYWRSYRRSLPSSVPTLPSVLSEGQLATVGARHPSVPGAVEARRAFLHALSDALEVAPSAFEHAYAMVTSRAFKIDGYDAPGVLLPLIDLANHDFTPNAQLVRLTEADGTHPAGSACLVAERAIAAGEEVTIVYAHLANDMLLLDYGFEVDANPYGENTE
jgi:hypothetical protein